MKVLRRFGLVALLLGCQNNAPPSIPDPVEVTQPLAAVQQPPMLTFSDLSIRSAQGDGDEPVDPEKDYPESVTRWDGKLVRIRGWYTLKDVLEGAHFLFLHPRAIDQPASAPTHKSDIEGFQFVDLNDDSLSVEGREGTYWRAQADETVLVTFKSNPGLPEQGWAEVTGRLKVGFADCGPYRWAFRINDASAKAVP